MDRYIPYKLTPEENKDYFENHIKPDLSADTKSVEQPVFVLIGGQPGAGKSRVTNAITTQLDNNAIVLDADKFRPQHPHYFEMVEKEPLNVFDLARDDVNAWLKQAGDFAIEANRHVVMDGTLRDKDHIAKVAQSYKDNGYKVELNIVATHERFSNTSIFERYEEGLKSEKIGRYVNPEFHKAAYEALPETIKYLEENKLVDSITIRNRDNIIVYENKLENGQWQKEPKAVEALEVERNRQPTAQERERLEKSRANTLDLMEKRQATSREFSIVRQEYDKFPVPGQEKAAEIDAQSIDAETQRLHRENKALEESIAKYDSGLSLYMTAQKTKMEKMESKINNAIGEKEAALSQHESKKPGLLKGNKAKQTWQAEKSKLQKEISDLKGEKKKFLAAKIDKNIIASYRRANPELTEAHDAAAQELRLRELKAQDERRKKEQEQQKEIDRALEKTLGIKR